MVDLGDKNGPKSKQFRLPPGYTREHAITLAGSVNIAEGFDAALSDHIETYFGKVARTYTLACCCRAFSQSITATCQSLY